MQSICFNLLHAHHHSASRAYWQLAVQHAPGASAVPPAIDHAMPVSDSESIESESEKVRVREQRERERA